MRILCQSTWQYSRKISASSLNIYIVVVDWGFTTLLTAQVISMTFYSERGKYDKFCSEALISAWGSLTCRKSTTRDPQLYFPSEGCPTQDFYALRKSIDPAGFEPANLRSSGMIITGPPGSTNIYRISLDLIYISLIFNIFLWGWQSCLVAGTD